MTARELPDVPALPEYSTDSTGVLTGNSDLETGAADWKPWAGPTERPPLPGHEHQLDPGTKVFPWLTERRAFAISWALFALAVVIRLGDFGFGGAS